MREISTEKVKVGEHVLVDGVEYVAEKGDPCSCGECELRNSEKCSFVPCGGVIFKRVDKVKKKPPVQTLQRH